ncbi:MAG: MFS transporter [Betaproteobacteria bacterium]|nr:MAG: MFS transporter [Betaproteobacteria bacterium]
MTRHDSSGRHEAHGIDSPYAWLRLVVAVLLSTIGGVGMWSVVVVLPAVQSEFGIARADASLPYTMTMIGFGLGGVLMGKLADRFGIVVPVALGAMLLSVGYFGSSYAAGIYQFTLLQGLLIGVGTSATFAPLMADTSLWFVKRRGAAVGIIASGNYLAGAVWPPVVQYFVQGVGWRETHIGIALFCLCTMLPLAMLLRRRAPLVEPAAAMAFSGSLPIRPLGFAPATLQWLLVIAGVACCVAMAMPQVHLVAYCSDLGYGAARGAEMLSLLLACGIISRLVFGWISDHIGGLRTLLLGSALQAFALCLYLLSDGLISLYLISALFGLFQGGIVPSYAIIVREYFSPKEAGARIGTVMMATMFGMAFGGWMSGVIFDWTGSYQTAFVHGIVWNLLNLSIAGWLLSLAIKRRPAAGTAG